MALPHPRLIAAGVALVLAFGAGWWLRGLQVKAATVDQTKAQAKADVQQAQRTSEAVQQHAQVKTETEIRYVTVTREVEKLVERPVYLQQCLDDDGLRAINAQILGADAPGSGPALPEAGHPAGHDGGLMCCAGAPTRCASISFARRRWRGCRGRGRNKQFFWRRAEGAGFNFLQKPPATLLWHNTKSV